MERHVRIKKSRLERFEFKPVKDIKSSVETNPELMKRLLEDFNGTLRAEGVVVDEAFKQEIHGRWRAQIKADIKEVVRRRPESRDWYLKRVIEGKPLKIRVEIDRATRKHKKSLVRDE